MTYTDEDLKRQKELLKENINVVFEIEHIESLIARLEAAEAVILNNETLLDGETPNLTDAWRKAAGK